MILGWDFIVQKVMIWQRMGSIIFNDGYSNKYTLDTEYLKILNLNSSDYTILNWIAILVEHRLFQLKRLWLDEQNNI